MQTKGTISLHGSQLDTVVVFFNAIAYICDKFTQTINMTTTVKEFAEKADVSARTVQRWIETHNKTTGATHPFGVNDPVSEALIATLEQRAGMRREEKPAPNNVEHKPREKAQAQPKPARIDWKVILPVLPLPMLGLAASYGVYYFALQFAPQFVAIGEAAAFELTYIGLAAMKNLTDRQAVVARRVSLGAVAVSVIYNTFAGVIHFRPDILTSLVGEGGFLNIDPVLLWIVAIIHGSPMAILAFFVADLIFHQKK